MTVANVVFETNRIRLVTDTVGYCNRKPAAFSRKVHIVERAGVAFVVRGYAVMAQNLANFTEDWNDFGSAIIDLAFSLSLMPVRFLQPSGAEVTLAGFDGNKPAVVRFLMSKGDGRVIVQRVDLAPSVYLAPSLGSHHIPADMTDEQLLRVALLQQDIAVRNGLNMCVGGDVEVTTLEAGKPITVRKLGEYPDKAKTAKLIARALPKHREMMAA